MARVSIYVSDELKARMDEARNALNWSDIARPAFEAALATLNHRKGQNMQTAIERLRASKAQHVHETDGDAKQAGRDWAANTAEYAELKRLAAIDLDHFGNGVNQIWPSIKSAISPDGDMDHDEISYRLFGESDEDEDSMIAFVEGVQEFFEEVEGQL